MATTKERLDDHDSRLGHVEERLGLTPPPPKKGFWEGKKEWLKTNPWISIPLSIIIPLCMLFGGYWLNRRKEWWDADVDTRVQSVLEKPGGITETLNQVRDTVNRTETELKTLEPFIRDIVQHQFDNVANLPSKTLGKRLPAVQHLVAVAENRGIKADAPTLGAIGRKLSAVDANVADFWPTAAQFINYRSQISVADVQSLLRPDLPNCTDHDPIPMEMIVNEEDEKKTKQNDVLQLPTETSKPLGKDTSRLVSARYENCRFTLDSPEEAEQIPYVRKRQSFALTFHHCQITYRGGQIRLLTPNPRPNALYSKGGKRSDVYAFIGQKLYFENCLFLFVINSAPPNEGQSLTQQLLAQSGDRFTVTAPTLSTHS
jgi:hypothetical protein